MADALLAQVQEVFEGQIVILTLPGIPIFNSSMRPGLIAFVAGFRRSEANRAIHNYHPLCHWCTFLILGSCFVILPLHP